MVINTERVLFARLFYPFTSEGLQLFQHIWPMLWPFPLDHFHSNSWQCIFDVALFFQDRMSSLLKYKTKIRSPIIVSNFDRNIHFTFHLKHNTDGCVVNSLLLPHLLLITAAWHTALAGLSPVAACCSIDTFNKINKSLKYLDFIHLFTTLDIWYLCYTHLMTCSRICKPKCLTTEGWALSANWMPHGTQKELVSLNSSQNCSDK